MTTLTGLQIIIGLAANSCPSKDLFTNQIRKFKPILARA